MVSGAVQEIELVPKTEVGVEAKLNRGERPPTGQLGEAIRFRCWFRREFQSSARKVPFLEVVGWKGATKGRWIGEVRGCESSTTNWQRGSATRSV